MIPYIINSNKDNEELILIYDKIITNLTDYMKLLNLDHNVKVDILGGNSNNDQFIFGITNNRIKLWKLWTVKKNNYDMSCVAFSVNGNKSNRGIGLDENDSIVLIISDIKNKNFFTIDLPKIWDIKNRKGEKYVMYKVDNDDIIDIIDIISFDELLRYYKCDNDGNDVDDENFHIEITI